MTSLPSRLRCKYVRASILLRTWVICGYKHKAEINPFRVLWIDPNQIVTRNDAIIPKDSRSYCYVINGDWDLTERRFEDHDVFIMLQEHFKYGVSWSETAFYEKIIDQIEKTGCYWNGCRSETAVLTRCGYLDQLFDQIKNTGFKIPCGLRYGETGLTGEYTPQEITVNMGRDGRFLYENGRHRLAIAKILDLPLIPVRVMIRHTLWQDLRDRIVSGLHQDNLSEYLRSQLSHPDISYLLGHREIP
jgi:hypothetical protein